MSCPDCGAPMAELGAFLACGACGRTVPRKEAHGTPARRQLPGVDIERLPSVIATPIAEYAAEGDPVLALFQICQTVELMLRLLVAVGLADAVRAGRGALPRALRQELSPRIEEPTLGKWWGMACAVAKHAPADSPVPELPGFVERSLAPLLARGPLTTSITEVRNTLAHSGIPRPLAARLLDGGHHQRFHKLLLSGGWLGDLELVVPRSGSSSGVLAGPHPGLRAFRPASDEVAQAVAQAARAGDAVVAVRREAVLPLWPLALYGLPGSSDPDVPLMRTEVPQIYSRRGELRLLLTPVGSLESAQSEAPEEALREFQRLFQVEEQRTRYEVAGFEDEMRRDAAKAVGRKAELRALRAAIDETREGVLWITGSAGIGKSYLVASLAAELLDEPRPGDVILPYRFRAGDGRCARSAFLRFAVERLREGEAAERAPQPVDELRALLARPRDGRIVFLVDGLDELAATDARFAEEVPLALSGAGVVWLCAGRPEWGLPEAFTPERCRHVFAAGVPEMSEADVREMIVDKIGPLAAKLLRSDRDADRERVVNPFIERVVGAPDGRLPLFVAYLIGDVLSSRMAPDATAEIPPSLADWYERQFRRYSVGDLAQVVTPILATLALAREPLAPIALQALLVRRTLVLADFEGLTLVMSGLACIESLLERVESPGGVDGYELRHHTAREQVLASRTTRIAVATARQALSDAVLDWEVMGRGAAGAYLFRRGIGHLVDDGHVGAAAGLLTEFGYHYERLRALGRDAVTGVLEDLAAMRQSGDLPTWRRFYGEGAHLLRRGASPPELQLLQAADAHADDSPVTRSAERWLEAAGPESHWLRSVWRPRRMEGSACLRTLEGHARWVNSLALHTDGRRVVSASDDRTLKVWDLETGACLHTLEGHTGDVTSVALHADGRRVISSSAWRAGSWDRTLKVWDLETGACLHTLEGHTDHVTSVAFHADGRRVISASLDATLKVWDLETGACLLTLGGDWREVSRRWDRTLKVWHLELRTLEGHTNRVTSVALHADGRRVVSASDDRTLKVWDLETGACLHTLEGHTGDVTSVALHADGRRVISASWDRTLKVWDLETGVCLHTLEGHTDRVTSVALHADGRRVISASWDRLKVWDLETGACLHTLGEHGYLRWFHADAGRAVSASDDGTLKVWDLETGACLHTLGEHGYLRWLHADAGRAVSASEDGTIQVWDLESSACRRTPARHTDRVQVVALHADGRRAVSASWDKKYGTDGHKRGTIKVWDLETGGCLRSLEGYKDLLLPVALGFRVVSASWARTLKVWDLETSGCLRTLKGHEQAVSWVALDADARRAVSAQKDNGTLKVWDLETGGCLRTLNGEHQAVRWVALDADARRAVSAQYDGRLAVWDLETGGCLHTLEGHAPVALHADGRLAVSASKDNTLKVWDLKRGTCLRTLEGHMHAVTSVALQADGCRAVSASKDKTLMVWDLETGACVATWSADSAVTCCAASASHILAGTDSGDLFLLQLMPPGPHAHRRTK